jgi:hypothetical protein
MAHARLATILMLASLGLAACARTKPPSLSMHEALAAAEATGAPAPPAVAAIRSGFGYHAPYMPLVVPPDVRRIWVTTHVTEEGTLVQGHWVFVPVKAWQWFVEQPLVSSGLGVGVPPDATPPPWPAPIESRRRPVVPWILDPKRPATPGEVAPAEPPAPNGARQAPVATGGATTRPITTR